MAQLADDDCKYFAKDNNSSKDSKINTKMKKNEFYCNECQSLHDITDLFLWSRCQHKYGRGCVIFAIKQQLYDCKMPICIVDNCNKLLLEEEASLVLPGDVLNDFYQIHLSYQPPTVCKPVPSVPVDDDEKKSQNQTQNSSDINDVVFGKINYDPSDSSTDDEIIQYDNNNKLMNKQQQLISNMDPPQPQTFECVVCSEEHSNDFVFEWSQCRHLYNRQCAENIVICSLFDRQIPQCIKCKQSLHRIDAQMLLPPNEMSILDEIYVINQSMNDNKIKKEQHINEQKEEKKDTDDEDEEKEKEKEELMPSILVLPDNDLNESLLPIDDDFDDSMYLNVDKAKELKQRNLFYCVCCKELISLNQNEKDQNGRFCALKCAHVTCKKCAMEHTRHEMEMLQKIPTCPVAACPVTITDLDMIEIYGRNEAKRLMDELFKAKSLKVPPFRPVMEAEEAINTAAGNVEIGNDERMKNEENVVEKEEIVLEQKKENDKKEKSENMGYCLTESCHKQGILSKDEKNRLDCTGCGISWCVSCGVPWHLGQNCEQYRTELENENLLMALQQEENMQFNQNELHFQNLYVDKGWKTCPVCLSVVEKNGGCNHITCACSAHWCWLCGCIVDENDLGKHYDIGKCELNEDEEAEEHKDDDDNRHMNAGQV